MFNKVPKLFAVLSLVFLYVSCSGGTVLLLSDPYTETLDDFALHKRIFSVRLRLAGFNVVKKTADAANTLTPILEEMENPADYIVCSPWYAQASRLSEMSAFSEVIIAGAVPPQGSSDNITGVSADRSEALTAVGRLAHILVQEAGKPALLLHSGGIEDDIIAGFEELPSEEKLIGIDISGLNSSDPLPQDFTENAANASVILLFAGTHNVDAFTETADTGNMVITEHAWVQQHWNDRIIASVENVGLRMRRAVLRVLRSENEETAVYYPAKLEKRRKRFDVFIKRKL